MSSVFCVSVTLSRITCWPISAIFNRDIFNLPPSQIYIEPYGRFFKVRLFIQLALRDGKGLCSQMLSDFPWASCFKVGQAGNTLQ